MKTKSRMGLRLTMTIVGVLVCAVAVGFFQAAVFGVDPFQCFAQGLFTRFTWIGYGTFYSVLNLIILVIIFFLDKHYIGIATFINLFLLGYVISFSKWCIDQLAPNPGLGLRAVFLLIGIVIMCFASALYFTADLGVSTYDAISLIMGDKKIKIGTYVVPFRFCRIFCDLICVVIGFALGAVVGIGTVITAFFMGPLIEFFNNTVALPLLYGKDKCNWPDK